MKNSGFGRTLSEIAERAASAIVARGHIHSDSARKMLLRRLAVEPGHTDSLIAPPVYEAASVWQSAEPSMSDLSGDLLRSDLVEALDAAGEQAIPQSRHPYWHQYEAWKQAAAGKSYMVTSGTGSGKTECFMVPMLNDLLDAAETGSRHGVRGIILYPLNALIDSQRERLASWIAPFDGRLSYALYNGHTPETRKLHARPAPAEIADRKTLRKNPANLLVTNVTMLEYMLTRAQDRGILEQSQGQLRWIVLDEAHTYVGAQAAEMALLLRRVRQAFGVKPEDVRLVATSATIGEGPETEDALRLFVSRLGGVSEDQVEIIMGREEKMILPSLGEDSPIHPGRLQGLDDIRLWNELASHPRARKARAEIRDGGARLSQLTQTLSPELPASEATSATRIILDAMAQAKPSPEATAFSPWRLNVFQRSQAGLWACVDPQCPCRSPELTEEKSDWPFGEIHIHQTDRCPEPCGAPVFEIGACNECGTPWLMAHREIGEERRLVQGGHGDEEDDFFLDAEPEEEGNSTVFEEVTLIGPADDAHPVEQLRHEDAVLRDVLTDEPGHTSVFTTAPVDRGCCAEAHHVRNRVGVQRFGAPFLLGNAIPQLLEATPRPEGSTSPLPMGGRRLLSFTDSRQGTARFAAKLQQEAERNLIRAAVWHTVQENSAGDPKKAEEIYGQIAKLKAIPGMESLVADLETKLVEAQGGFSPLSWQQMVNAIAGNPDLVNFAGIVWRSRPFGGKTLSEEPARLAEFLLLREVFRRPKLQNNVETMGLARLCWPELERRMENGSLPAPLSEAGHSKSDWVGLGLAAVDYAFRSRLAVKLEKEPVDFAHWISPRQASTQVAEPGTEFDTTSASRRTHTWYNALSKARIVMMIYRLIGGSNESATDRERCQAVLDQLWTHLRQSGILSKADPGCWQLDFRKSGLRGLETLWRCPVTQRLLPYSIAGVTPNAPLHEIPLTPVTFPRLPIASVTGLTASERGKVNNWLQTDPGIAALRKGGHWTDLQDRGATFAPFLRAQEHSAQIDRNSLKGYEDEFRAGRINVLNCSTTMEMGVDIPNVGTVVNTNVPPAPSNYRQRIGRAGRRGEPWALSFTFCKDKPLDWQVFRQPEALLRADIPAPAVRLDSPVLVSRHVNALLLGMFLRREGGVKVSTKIGTFFGAAEFKSSGDLKDVWVENALADQFQAELDGGWADDQEIMEAMAHVVRGTVLEGKSGLAAGTATAFADLRRRWRAEYEQLVDGWRASPERDPTKAFYSNRAGRMRREFMMTELARRGFTPAYGYPVDVVSFSYIHDKTGASGPSRQLDIAIRDYAPGSEVVIDGLVHKSDGILPAWSNRADADNIEDLRTHWHCDNCAAFGLSRNPVDTCPECETPTKQGEVLRPSGFLGRSKPHAGYEQVSFVPPDRPRVSSGAVPWITLPDPSVGRVRISRQGQVLFTASGGNGHGYAICLACGQSEPEHGSSQENPLSKSMKTHFPLQPLRGNLRHDGKCPACDDSSRKIRRNVVLGNEITTDTFEWQLRDFGSTRTHRAQAMAIAAALREALSKELGIEAEDMGVSAAPSLLEDGDRCMSVFLFDRASGGSGFSPLALDRLSGLVARATKILECPAHCEAGCPECVLRGDIQYDQNILDRRGALETLTSIRQRLRLPEELQLFGKQSRALQQDLPTWLLPRLRGGQVSDLTIFLHGKPEHWDLRDLSAILPRRDEAKVANVVLPKSLPTLMEAAAKVDLVRFLAECGARLHMVDALPMKGNAPIICQCTYEDITQSFAAIDENASIPESGWGSPEGGAIVFGPDELAKIGQPLSAEKLALFKEGNSVHVDVARKLDGPVGKFGVAFWRMVKEMRPQLFQEVPLAKVTYSDRYLRSPLTVRLLQEILRTMPGRSNTTRISVVSSGLDRGSPWQNHNIEDNWANDAVRLKAMQALLVGANVQLMSKRDCPHPRCLKLEWEDGRQALVNLDQGVGTWIPCGSGSVHFDVDGDPVQQASKLSSMNFEVRNRQPAGVNSPVWVTW
jgi:DEAD/DEAH box helicase domain-containing protein